MTIGADRRREMLQSAKESAVDLRGFEAVVSQNGGAVSVVVVTEDWCGDTMRALPLLARVADAVDGFAVTVFRAADVPNVNARLAAEGLDRLPKILCFDSSRSEIARFMERSEAVQAEMEAAVEEFGDPRPLMQSEQRDDKRQGMEIIDRIFIRIKRAHEERLWSETANEWLELLGANSS